MNKVTTDYPAGATIFNEGEPVTGIYEIYSGKIKLLNSYGKSKNRIIGFAKREEMLGFHGLGGDMIYPITAVALEESQVTFIPIDIFYKTIKANPDMALYLVKFFADQLKETENRLKHQSAMSAIEKVAFAIITVVNSFGFDKKDPSLLDYTPSRKDLASLAGTTYETIIRNLAELEKKKVIKLEAKSIRIIDLPKLNSISENQKYNIL